MKEFPYDAWKTNELRFPNNVWVFPAVAGSSGVIGYNVFGAVMDEVNFMAVVENSKSVATGGYFDQADTLYKSLIRRMKSRFMKRGKLPGILLQISSSRYPEDFTERRLAESADDPWYSSVDMLSGIPCQRTMERETLLDFIGGRC